MNIEFPFPEDGVAQRNLLGGVGRSFQEGSSGPDNRRGAGPPLDNTSSLGSEAQSYALACQQRLFEMEEKAREHKLKEDARKHFALAVCSAYTVSKKALTLYFEGLYVAFGGKLNRLLDDRDMSWFVLETAKRLRGF